jgi:beta-mannanase
MDVETDYVDWGDGEAFGAAIAGILRSNRVPLIVPEPWSTASGEARHILTDTIAGANDGRIRQMARLSRRYAPTTILLRWGHEMDAPGNYPWAAEPAEAEVFIHAYRHVVDLFRSEGTTNVKWMWSPAGTAQSALNYPGDAYVDYVGLTILENPDWDARAGLPPRDFVTLFDPQYQAMTRLNKPVVIAELGVTGGADFQKRWLRAAFSAFPRYPTLRGVVYFNAVNAVTPFVQSPPDWRIDPAYFPPQ